MNWTSCRTTTHVTSQYKKLQTVAMDTATNQNQIKDEYDFIEEIDWQCTHDGVRLDIPQDSYVYITHGDSWKSSGIW